MFAKTNFSTIIPPSNPPFMRYPPSHSSLAHLNIPRRGIVSYNKLKEQEKSVTVGASGIVKSGVFAAEDLEEDSVILEYQGVSVSTATANQNRALYERNHWSDYYQLEMSGTEVVIDATLEGNQARYANHCCSPNAVFRKEPLSVRVSELCSFARYLTSAPARKLLSTTAWTHSVSP